MQTGGNSIAIDSHAQAGLVRITNLYPGSHTLIGRR